MRPKYLDSMVLLTNKVEQPISIINLSPTSLIFDRCVCKNQVEKMAGETETFIISKVSFQDGLKVNVHKYNTSTQEKTGAEFAAFGVLGICYYLSSYPQ